MRFVGWVERSETHRLGEIVMPKSDGFRCALPILRTAPSYCHNNRLCCLGMSACERANYQNATYPRMDIVAHRGPPSPKPPSTEFQLLRATLRGACVRPILSVHLKESGFGQALQQQALQQKTPPQ